MCGLADGVLCLSAQKDGGTTRRKEDSPWQSTIAVSNPKERLQYLAAGTAGAAAPQGAGYGAVTDRAAEIVTAALF